MSESNTPNGAESGDVAKPQKNPEAEEFKTKANEMFNSECENMPGRTD